MSIVAARWVKIFNPEFLNGDQTNSVVLATNAYGCRIVDRNGGGIVNSGTVCYTEDTQLTDFGAGTTGGPVWTGTIYPSQVKFPATQVPSTNANCLDDYEEGTFTPGVADNSLDGSGESQAYTTQVGTYTKIGRRVFYDLTVRTSSIGTLADETVRITGLPFTAKTLTSYSAIGTTALGVGLAITAGVHVAPRVDSNTAYLALELWNQTAGTANMFVQANWTADGGISVSGSYDAAA